MTEGRAAGRAPEVAHRRLAKLIQLIIAIGFLFELIESQWMSAAITLGILLLTSLPVFAARWARVSIPPQFELLTIAFLFASLFLGERREFYERFWWWDLALHATSGVLLGIFGFLLVYVLNEDSRVEVKMKPGFVAFFAFCFSLMVGALWEIFEFGVDQIFDTQMQKPMFGDPSGLTDTMWDLIVDGLGTAFVVVYGWRYMRRGEPSFIERWVRRFISDNPRLFPGARGPVERANLVDSQLPDTMTRPGITTSAPLASVFARTLNRTRPDCLKHNATD